MAVLRDTPYAAFNFLVSFDGVDPDSVQAGFSGVAGLDQSVEVLSYRAGNYKSSAPRALPGTSRLTSVSLTRGLIGDTALYEWMTASLEGSPHRRTVVIQLQSEDRDEIVQAWRLGNAWPTALEGPELDAMGGTVAIERLVLVADSMTIE